MSLFFNQDTAPSQLLPEQGPQGPIGPQGPAGAPGASTWDELEGKPSTFTPSAHKTSHAASGNDALAPSDIGAQSIFESEGLTLSANVTLTPSRAKTWTIGMFVSSTFDITLPTSGIQVGDILVIKAGTTFNGTAIIKRSATQVTTVGTLLAGRSFRFIATSTADTSWVADGTYTHTHAIADITGLQTALDFSTAITSATAPATSGSVGSAGSVRYDGDYIYICTATDTWRRTAITGW